MRNRMSLLENTLVLCGEIARSARRVPSSVQPMAFDIIIKCSAVGLGQLPPEVGTEIELIGVGNGDS